MALDILEILIFVTSGAFEIHKSLAILKEFS